ncbi:MAG: serine/threonine protein kinase [Planctomycetes bacterium]|nr:serine/threonine protein kinase [Planctomycetota bacterium]
MVRLDPGERLGDWVIVAQLARGGQGAVLRARHGATGAPAALKVLLDPTEAAARRFAQEARVLERVAHPNVVRALGRGEAPGAAWLALELVEGEDLLALVRRGVPPVEVTARALAQVALALEHCHLLGVVHRDLKPGNVLVEAATGRAVLVDFGLVKRDPGLLHLSTLDDEGEALSLSGSIKGTPEYMAPEQVSPRLGEVGPATDAWGLGATLFHLLTGEAPFGRGAAPIVMRRITRQPAKDPRALNPAVPEAVALLCLRCLAKDPAARPSPVEVAAALAPLGGAAPPRAPARPRAATPSPLTPPSSESPTRPALPARRPQPGETFAGLRLVRELGRGAFGVVYEAARPDGAKVALKVLLAASADDARARFLREAAAGRAVEHEGVVRVLGHGEDRGLPWLAMELVEGAKTLDAFAAGVSLRARVRLFADVARAVDAAHRAGLVHRDLKPSNVLVSADGRPKVVDLGLARHLDKERLTMSGAVMGTVHYMAPEQVMGRAAEAGPAADVWSLGVMLYELIADRRPFEGDTLIEVMAAIIEDAPEDPCAGVPLAPPGLSRVCRRALAREPGARFERAADLADAALAALRERPRGRRVPALAALGVTAAVVLVLAGVLGAMRASARRADVDEVGRRARALLKAPRLPALDEARALAADARALGVEAEVEDAARVLEGLAALATGDVAGAEALAASLVDGRRPAALALRGGVAAHGGDPARAAQDLTRAIEGGFSPVEARAWRARALARRGPSAHDAPRLLDDLDVVAAARPLAGEEAGWRARAHLALGDLDAAARALEARDDAPADARWAVALARAAATLEVAPERAQAALAGLDGSPPAALADEAARLAERAARALERQAAAAEVEALAPVAVVCAALRGPLSPTAAATLARRAVGFGGDVTPVRLDLAWAAATLAPDDRAVQREVGLLVQYVRSAENKRQFLPALRRALSLGPTAAERFEEEVVLCQQLGLLAAADRGAGRPVADGEECLALAERLLAGDLEAPLRATLLGVRACARRALGDAAGALADLEAAKALHGVDVHTLWRAQTLDDLERPREALAAFAAYLAAQTEGHMESDRAAHRVWDLRRTPGAATDVAAALEKQARLRPTTALWWARLARWQLSRGQFSALPVSMARVVEALEAEDARALAGRARAMAEGVVGEQALDALLEELERRPE